MVLGIRRLKIKRILTQISLKLKILIVMICTKTPFIKLIGINELIFEERFSQNRLRIREKAQLLIAQGYNPFQLQMKRHLRKLEVRLTVMIC